ncbi:MAG TPA: zinc-ribbon domain-containing protein, partial [Pseudobdellovibrionaceae bacterium]|nr:zinc-ribbon domain-containing protein [Pseudobdellovibrionaceae bacterium]
KVHFLNLPVVEAFFEFYQFYYFKSGKSEFLKVDETAYLLLETFIKLTEAIEPDRYGVVSIEFTKILDHCKNELGINLNNDHFTRLEQKGVYTKRRTVSDQVLLQFEKKEFINLLMSWRILREIDKWNEKGFVDPDEKEAKPKKRSDGPECVSCGAPLPPNAKFCAECGTKVSSAA